MAKTAKSAKRKTTKAKTTKAEVKVENPHDPVEKKGSTPPFLVVRQKQRVWGKIIEVVSIRFKDQELIDALRDITKSDEFWAFEPVTLASSIFHWLPILEMNRQMSGMSVLINWLNIEFERTKGQLENLLKDGLISYSLLWAIFKKGDDVYVIQEGKKQGGKIVSVEYLTGWSNSFVLTLQVVNSDGRKFRLGTAKVRIREFHGAKKIAELPILLVDSQTRADLEKRGQLFAEIANKATYLEYNSHIIWQTYFGPQFYRAVGRCMIDQVSFGRVNPSYEDHHEDDKVEMDAIPSNMLFACNCRVKGFSFASKRWGEFSVDDLKPVVFNDTAFDTLVLAPKTKKLIRSLVENAGNTFQDIIYGKGGGIIFLLHGDPGTGKTLTAESITEIRHKPLYSVSIGELGTEPIKLEESLRQILEMATIWDANVLIDEADIFLEARSDDSDIERNAMVGVFLRLLEYHQGVLFLTTNRVKSFDAAFHSRVSLAIKYPKLDEVMRTSIWHNLLAAAKIDGINAHRLAKHVVNGRQIKTAIRLAQALAKAEHGPVTEHLLELPLIHAEEFIEDEAGGEVHASKYAVSAARIAGLEPVV